MSVTAVSDVIVPSVFTPYVQSLTMEKSALIASGAVVRDGMIDGLLAGGGITFDIPAFKDLTNTAENISTDDSTSSTPQNIGTFRQTGVRLSRNQSWSSYDLTAALAGKDPMEAIAQLVAGYWTRRAQAAFVAVIKGVFADNAAAPTGSDTHTQNDLTRDISGVSYTAGTTDFSASAFIDAAVTMGDAMGDLSMVMVHSIVYAKMQKNNLIDFIPDSRGEVNIPTFLGRIVIVDDGLPVSTGVYESWLFGAGAVRWGVGSAKVPTETFRNPDKGTGGGQDTLYSRVEWLMHPEGHSYIGTAANGGPSNATSSNNLANAGSWSRRCPERKQVKIARLITRES